MRPDPPNGLQVPVGHTCCGNDTESQCSLNLDTLRRRRPHLVQDPVFGSSDGGVQDVDPGLFLLRTDGQKHQVGNLQQHNTSGELLQLGV